MKVTVELTKDQIFEALDEAELSNPERREILKKLFPHKGYTDNSRLVADITDFLYNA